MIYTVTFNPSLDYVMKVPDFCPGEVNRTEEEAIYPGGKGVNVSVVLKNLGLENKALGFVAGFTGEALEAMIRDYGVDADFIHVDTGFTRINVKLKAQQESVINGRGCDIREAHLQALFEKLDALQEKDMLVLAGSIPAGLPDNVYETILERLDGRGIRAVVDATGDLLVNVLKYKPFLIKPNNHELGEIFGKELKTVEEIEDCARQLQRQGAQNVLVSMAGDGALLVCADGSVMHRLPPEGELVNSVGAGDSMVAGFIAGYTRSGSYEQALLTGLAAGSASAFGEWLATREEVETLLHTMQERRR